MVQVVLLVLVVPPEEVMASELELTQLLCLYAIIFMQMICLFIHTTRAYQ